MKNRLTHNLGLKILSVVVAAVLWLMIMNIADPTVTETFSNIPVQIVNDTVITSRGYGYSIESGERASVKVKGRRSVVDNLSEDDFTVTADFNSLNSMYMATMTVECTSEYASELIVSLRNETMAVKLEDQETRPFNVRIIQDGEVKDGYYCGESKVSTSLVQVTASVTQIAKVKEVTVNVDVTDRAATFTADYELTAFGEDGSPIDARLLTFSQDSVAVTTSIYPIKDIEVRVIAEGTVADGYYVEKLEYAPTSVQIAGEEATLRRLNQLAIPCNVTAAKTNIEQQISLAEYLSEEYGDTYISVEDVTIGVLATVSPVEEKALELTDGDIEARNLDEGLECVIYSMWSTEVLIHGSAEDIENVEASDLDLYVDLTGCVAGTYSRQIKSGYDGRITVDTGSVMVRISEKEHTGD